MTLKNRLTRILKRKSNIESLRIKNGMPWLKSIKNTLTKTKNHIKIVLNTVKPL